MFWDVTDTITSNAILKIKMLFLVKTIAYFSYIWLYSDYLWWILLIWTVKIKLKKILFKSSHSIYTGGLDSKEITCNARDPGLIPGLRRSSGVGNGNPLQCSCLDIGACESTKSSCTRLND